MNTGKRIVITNDSNLEEVTTVNLNGGTINGNTSFTGRTDFNDKLCIGNGICLTSTSEGKFCIQSTFNNEPKEWCISPGESTQMVEDIATLKSDVATKQDIIPSANTLMHYLKPYSVWYLGPKGRKGGNGTTVQFSGPSGPPWA